jgi:hypothetical protein
MLPRFDELMAVLVASAVRRMRKTGGATLACALTWAQITADLRQRRGLFGYYGTKGLSRRTLARTLGAMERSGFIRRHTETQRDGRGRIVWKLTLFSFGANGILWIKKQYPSALAQRDRSIVPNLAPRFKSDGKSKEERAVDKAPTARPGTRKPTGAHRANGHANGAGRALAANSAIQIRTDAAAQDRASAARRAVDAAGVPPARKIAPRAS